MLNIEVIYDWVPMSVIAVEENFSNDVYYGFALKLIWENV